MYNLLLDALPEDYEGYLIRTDYRIGVQISQALADDDLEPYERLNVAFGLLYGHGVPADARTALTGLQWFMNGGAEPAGDAPEDNGVAYFSFDYDASRLYSGFRRAYGLELDRVRLHWFRFLPMMADLGDCAFTQVIGYRSADTSKMDAQTRAAYNTMKRRFALPQPESEDEREFMAKLAQ